MPTCELVLVDVDVDEQDLEKIRKGRRREKGRMKGQGMGKVGRQNWNEEKLLSSLM